MEEAGFRQLRSLGQLPPLSSAVLGFLCGLLIPSVGAVGIASSLPYPTTEPTPDEIAAQIYFVNHFFGVRNIHYGDKKNPLVLVNRAANAKPKQITLERHLNNEYADREIRAMDLAIFRSGKLRGTGILVEDYHDPTRSLTFKLWLPAIRKIRRHAEPDHGQTWGGGVFTFGDIYLRRPSHERHEVLKISHFEGCLDSMTTNSPINSRYFDTLPSPGCLDEPREVYELKSHTLFSDWWYDYRIVYVDKQTFADYRSDYFKNDKLVKRIDKHWHSMNQVDPRNQYWTYWYGKRPATGLEAIAFIGVEAIKWDKEVNPGLWSEQTLRKISR
ncbi:MAG: outer membrane lipoprotein-sorting protein [bacterium]